MNKFRKVIIIGLLLLVFGYGIFDYFSEDNWVGSELSFNEDDLNIFTYALEEDTSINSGSVNITAGDMVLWNGSTSLGYMMPGYGSDYIEVSVYNNGTNVVNIYKMVNVTGWGTGLFSEPEENAEANIGGPVDDLHNVTSYTLNYTVYDNLNNVVRTDTVFLDEDDYTVGKVDGEWIDLGRLEPDQKLVVKQGYKLLSGVGNEYQGDKFSFRLQFLANSLE